uniref:Glycosyltransferase RgtA/B/C/D-like domain-containing protein n=1 Tax=Thermosporothrix sp. COM3 TaxID=2490863 RepID=A0A455SU36_9CHLR|nr:hypothetical protein KTC_57590 [Thermosporothrix sp. COM3]
MTAKIVRHWRVLVFVTLGIVAFLLRIYGLNWDQGNGFHPDERQILFRVMELHWPSSFAEFLDVQRSPLNPHFFAYGSFPLYVLASVGFVLDHLSPGAGTFSNLALVGRVLSALLDSGTVILTGWLALLVTREIVPGRGAAWDVALLAAAFVAFTPLQLQLSHFYTVDTMLLFLVLLTIIACVGLVEARRLEGWAILLGVSYGLAMATKFSAAPLAVPILVALALRWYRRRDWAEALVFAMLIFALAGVACIVAQPYALLDSANFIAQVSEQGSMARGALDFPYVRQFAGTIPYLYQLSNMVLWGLGLTVGVLSCLALLWLCVRMVQRKTGTWTIVLVWVLVYGLITGSFYVKFMRYMLPVYPFLALMGATALIAIGHWLGKARLKWRSRLQLTGTIGYGTLVVVALLGVVFQGLALLSVYSQPNTRIQASRWMYQHLKPGSVLTYEQWDDPLPVALGRQTPSQFVQYTYQTKDGNYAQGLDLYGEDTPEKARQLATILSSVQVVTMATDRLDLSIPRLPDRYPMTIHYYDLLFSGKLGFHLAARFEVRPQLLGITLDDSHADESYSVFDHPRVRIFVRDEPYPYTAEQLYQKLVEGVSFQHS